MIVGDGFHLTYCSNIHAGERWPDVRRALEASMPRLRAALGVKGPMGIGLRLSALAAETLSRPEVLTRFRAWLEQGDYYVFTINGFPYGAFHGARVKERVYLPDWRSDKRVAYSNRLADLLAALLPEGSEIVGSVSTVPGAFKREVKSDADVSAIADGILRHAVHLVALRTRTGKTIALAIEPEPACFLETIDEAVRFFETHLFDPARAKAHGLSVEDVRRHVGMCCDACHMAVEFEDPAQAFDRLRRAGVSVFKIQVSSAIDVAHPYETQPRAALERFADDVYLHQVVANADGVLERFADLPEALEAQVAYAAAAWRVHFHVPVFLESLGAVGTTQAYLLSVLQLLKAVPICRCLEVETYTWDVLPPEHRATDMVTAIARELDWVRSEVTK